MGAQGNGLVGGRCRASRRGGRSCSSCWAARPVTASCCSRRPFPAGTKSTFHLRRDSDEVAYVLSGEVTFKIGDEVMVAPGTCAFMPRGLPHAWSSTGAETVRFLFLYTPAKAGGVDPRAAANQSRI